MELLRRPTLLPRARKTVGRVFPSSFRIGIEKGDEAGDRLMTSPASTVSLKMVELRRLEPLIPRLPERPVTHKPLINKKRRSAKRGKK
jgi:hypothetical protein